MNVQLTNAIKAGTKHFPSFLMLIILMSTGTAMAYAESDNGNPGSINYSLNTLGTFCGVQMQDSVVGYTKSNTNNQIFYLLTVKNTGSARDSFNFSYTSRSTPLNTFIETVNGTIITKTPGIEPGASYQFIIRFVVPNGSPAETTNYTNLVASSSICGTTTTDTTHLLTNLYSGKVSTGDSCDVQINKTSDKGTVTAGNTITYTISIINNLPGVANDVFVNDTLASSLVYQSSVVTVAPSNFNYSLIYNSASRVVQFRALTALGQSQPVTFTIKVKAVCTAVPSVTNKVVVSSSTYDNKFSNDTSSVATNVTTSYTSPTAVPVTSCYNSSATLTASGAASGLGYKWYTSSSGGISLSTGSTYTTPVLNSSTSYYVSYYNLDTTVCEGPRTAVAVTVKSAPVVTTVSGTTVCPNDAVTFTESASGTSLTYQWQVSTNGGSSWTSLTNTAPYSAVASSTLGISSVSYLMNGYQYRCNVASGGCMNTISSSAATLTVRKPYTWLGVNTDWDDAQNWCSGVPDSSSDVTIPSGLTYYPVINGTASTHDIYTGSGTTVTLDAGTIRIFETITNNGVFDARTGTVNMKGSSAQTLAGSMFTNKTIKNLVISNTSGSGLSVSSAPNDTLLITGALTFDNSASKLNTGDNITIVSNALGTARVGTIGPGNTITGKVTVECYINTGTAPGQHGKAWQFLSVPTSGQTVKESWMENGSTPGNYGTMISSPSGTDSGFDMYSVAPSIKYFSDVTGNWKAVGNTNNLISNSQGYMLFVRGDRSVTSITAPPNTTVLRTKGTLFVGDQPVITVKANSFQSVGNPYASPIDFSLIIKDANVDDAFYIYDPYLYGTYGVGGYQTLSSVNNWKPVPGGTSSYPTTVLSSIIQPGQAFFVHSSAATDGSLSLTEACKSTASRPGHSSRIAAKTGEGQKQFLRASLITNTGLMADGNVVAFDKRYRDHIDGNDALKIANSGENFAVKREGKLLAIEAQSPLSAEDTIYYNISNLNRTTYQLSFAPENMKATGLQAFLLDKFLGTETPVSLTDSTSINITVSTNSASAAPDRFKIVFRQMSALPVTITSITATAKNPDNIIQWGVANESGIKEYEIEKSTDGNQFNQIQVVKAVNSVKGKYEVTDNNVNSGPNYYRIKILSVDGNGTYTQVVKVINGKQQGTISIYPNPINDDVIHLQLNNQPPGIYKIKLYNAAGQLLISKNISYAGGSSAENIKCDNFPKGIYQLQINKPDGNKHVAKLFIN
ncbi:MAG: T9SS type A sorting domain-containing protein [Ginsengibacter sp.]